MDLFVSADLVVGQRLLLAALVGALVGIEHERSAKADTNGDLRFGGVRTYALFGLAGALAAWIAGVVGTPWLLGGAVAGFLVLLGLAHHQRTTASLTTEGSAIVVFLLGAATSLGHEGVALQVGIGVTALLASRGPLHRLASSLSPEDVRSGLQLLIGLFVVMPLLPAGAIDPWGVLVPREAVLLVLLISGLSLAGYVATRLLGPERGLVVAGLTGGMVSSTAVTLAMARQSKQQPETASSFALGVMAAWGVMAPRVVLEVVLIAPTLVPRLVPPLAGLMLGLLGTALALRRRARGETPPMDMRNPFSIPEAARFTAVFVLIKAMVTATERWAAPSLLFVVAALAGTTDVDAITLSLAGGAIPPSTAVAGILIAVLSNTWIKVLFAWIAGERAFARSLTVAAAIGTGLGAAGWMTTLWW
jgi:uncharacterized membrane protein (DUF4010 family)